MIEDDSGNPNEQKSAPEIKKINKSDEMALNEKVKGSSEDKIKKHPFDELKDDV